MISPPGKHMLSRWVYVVYRLHGRGVHASAGASALLMVGIKFIMLECPPRYIPRAALIDC